MKDAVGGEDKAILKKWLEGEKAKEI